jgi:hypothetical protein
LILLAILGAALVLAGLFGLGHCIREGYRIRRKAPPPEAAAARLRRLVTVNLASVAGAALGLAFLTAYFVLR